MSKPLASVEFIDGIAVITIDNPPVNNISIALRGDLHTVFDQIAATAGVRGALVVCAGSTFVSGADISEFSGPPQEEAYRELFFRFENIGLPIAAAMHGTVFGGGVEISLACHYRLAAPGTRFGLPEVTLGIFPGAGGTQRMPRLIGIDKALEMIVSAKPVDAAGAVELGFVDAVITGDLRTGALAWLNDAIAAGKGVRRTSDLTVAPVDEAVLEKHRATARKLYPNRAAALAAIDVVAASARLPLAEGLVFETEQVNLRKESVESRALVHVFFAERETRKIPGLPADVKSQKVLQGGIVGSGTMGGGIAMCFANAGLPVTIVDISAEALQRGLGVVDANYESMVKRGRLTAEDKAKRMALITGSLDYADLGNADVIIEAAVERMDLKKAVFAKLDAVAKPGAVLATNTSTLDIDELATAVSRPQDVIGMHFFSPANVMPLLEVIRTKSTSAECIRTAMDLAKPLRKTPVLARVCYGFIGNRMMEGYAREAQRMVLEGATPRQVDSALEKWGMAMGILAVFDMAGVDVGVNVHRSNADQYPPDPSYYQADIALYDAGRLGQKNGKGYYRYEKGDRTRYDDPVALELIRAKAAAVGVAPREHTEEEVLERCLYPLINEAFRILEEGVAVRASDVDVVWAAGYGFPRYRGGPLFYADTIGLKTVYDGMLKYRDLFGPMHWQPAALLEKLVKEGKTLAQWEGERA